MVLRDMVSLLISWVNMHHNTRQTGHCMIEPVSYLLSNGVTFQGTQLTVYNHMHLCLQIMT